jgi:DNA polymerase V
MYALIDCNNFYASCERLFMPKLIGKPIVVLSNNDGCVIARSNEAKQLGIPMGAAAFEYEKFFIENSVSVFSANFALYGDMSNRVMSILHEFSPECEVYSIDEAFLKLSGFQLYNLKEFGAAIYKSVVSSTGIPISIGIAPTKALAKVANRIAKKYPGQTENCYYIENEAQRIKALKWLQVEDVWGIGRKHSFRLKNLGVKTAYDFTQMNDKWVAKNMSIIGLRLKRDLEGIPTLGIEDIQIKKNIATTRSFERNITKYSEVEERIITFSVLCAEKLRAQKSSCTSLIVFIQTNFHRQDLEQYRKSVTLKLPFPTNSSIEISKFACEGLKIIFKEGISYKKAGVIIMDFKPEEQLQLSLFENSNPKHTILMKVMDQLNAAFGRQKVKLASQDLKRVWKMKQEMLSPHYTTNIKDVIKIQV